MLGWTEILFIIAVAAVFIKRREIKNLPSLLGSFRKAFRQGLTPDSPPSREVEELNK